MPQEVLNEPEFELVNIVGAELAVNQRDLSRQMNVSLGMTNMLLRRLIAKGYIRIQQLNQRKVQYLLTPKGFAEKMRKSVKYTLKTINSISLIKNRLRDIILKLHGQGVREFGILGVSDFALLIEMAVQELGLGDCRLHYINQWSGQISSGVLLICKEDVVVEGTHSLQTVNLVHELSKDNLLLQLGEKHDNELTQR